MTFDGTKLRAIREEFPVLAGSIYLNTNSTGAFPRAANEALEGFVEGTLRSDRWRDCLLLGTARLRRSPDPRPSAI